MYTNATWKTTGNSINRDKTNNITFQAKGFLVYVQMKTLFKNTCGSVISQNPLKHTQTSRKLIRNNKRLAVVQAISYFLTKKLAAILIIIKDDKKKKKNCKNKAP